MDDLISRQAAIDAIDAILPAEPMKNEYTQGITCGAALAIEYVKQLPSVQPEKRTEKRTETHACDLIDRQAAVDALHMHLMYRMGTDSNKKRLDEWINNLPSAQPEAQWIPCSERLPKKKRKTYWVCTNTEYQCECRWTNNRFGFGESDNWGWSIFDTPQYTEVIAWMPLPKPYGGDTK